MVLKMHSESTKIDEIEKGAYKLPSELNKIDIKFEKEDSTI